MSNELEVQLTRIDGKLEKHIGITETILENQKDILEDIREEMHNQNKRFISREELTGLRSSVVSEVKETIAEVKGHCYDRIDIKAKADRVFIYKLLGAVLTSVITVLVAYIETGGV